MKNIVIGLVVLFTVQNPALANAATTASRPVVEVVEAISKKAGRVPPRGAAEALEGAFKMEGSSALEAARTGGIELAEAAAKHGNEVFKAAARVPEAIPALAARAEVLLPLVARYGDEVLQLESKLPGLAQSASASFPDKALLDRLNRMPADEAKRVIQFSAHATEPAASRALLDAVERDGKTVLERLSPSQILAGGMSVAMVTTATAAPIAASAAPIAAAKAPEDLATAIGDFLARAGMSTVIASSAFALAVASFVGWKVHRMWRSRAGNPR